MGWDKNAIDPIKWAKTMAAGGGGGNPRDAINIFAFSVFNRIVERTPVDTGAARQNWLVTLNNQTEEFEASKTKGGRVMSDGKKAIESAKGDDTIYIQNNLPYIRRLEYGHSKKQAPHGMVDVTLAKADTL